MRLVVQINLSSRFSRYALTAADARHTNKAAPSRKFTTSREVKAGLAKQCHGGGAFHASRIDETERLEVGIHLEGPEQGRIVFD